MRARVVAADLEATKDAVARNARRVADLLRSDADPAVPVPGLDWTVGEVAAHLVTGLRGYHEMLLGAYDVAGARALAEPGAPPGEVGRVLNAKFLDDDTERDLLTLADDLVGAADRLLEAAAGADTQHFFPIWTGYDMDLSAVASAMLGELLVHGLDMARGLGRRWPIAGDDARLVHAGVADLLPHYVDPTTTKGVRVGIEVRIRGGPRFVVRIDDGSAQIEATPTSPIDCWISAEPVTFLLVNYRRIGRSRPIFTGKVIVGGRRPWLAAGLSRYLSDI
jgi:uncharacterized protein (TIGR03083 family)